jgi:hypothetical protein
MPYTAIPRRLRSLLAGAVVVCGHWRLVATAVFVAVMFDGRALAEDIHITVDPCSAQTHLVAHDAHVSVILRRLAESLQFRLRFEADDDPLVSIDTHRELEDLLVHLAPTGNLVTKQTKDDPRCPDQLRIVEVWVLPTGQQLQQERHARLAQEGIDQYMRGHGVDPEDQPPPHPMSLEAPKR